MTPRHKPYAHGSEEAHLLPPGAKLVCHGGVCSHIPDLKNPRNDSALSRIWVARQNRRAFPLSETATSTGTLCGNQYQQKKQGAKEGGALPNGPFRGDIGDIHVVNASPANMGQVIFD